MGVELRRGTDWARFFLEPGFVPGGCRPLTITPGAETTAALEASAHSDDVEPAE